MGNSFIPSFHWEAPESKNSASWAMKVIGYYFYNTGNFSLLDGKDVRQIDGYSSGDFDMKEFIHIFKSEQKRALKNANPNTIQNNQLNHYKA